MQRAGADDTALAPAAGNQRRMRRHAAAGRKHAFSRAHAFHIFGIRFFANQNDFFAFLPPFHRHVGGKRNLAYGAAGTGRKTLDQKFRCGFGFRINHRMQHFIKL